MVRVGNRRWISTVSAVALGAALCAVADPLSNSLQAQPAPQEIQISNTPLMLSGSLARGDETMPNGEYVDMYIFEGRRGQTIAAAMVSDDVDAYLVLVGPNEFTAENDDMEAGTTDAMLSATLPANGTYILFATSLNPRETGAYEMVVANIQPGGGSASPPPPRPQPPRPAPPRPAPPPPQVASGVGTIAPGASIRGSLASSDPQLDSGKFFDAYTFNAQAGQSFTIDMMSDAFDPLLVVLGPNDFATEMDDGGEGVNSRLTFTAPATGQYTIGATSFAARAQGAYTLRLTQNGGGNARPGPRPPTPGPRPAPPTPTPVPPPPPQASASGETPLRLGQPQRGTLARGDTTLQSGEFVDSYTIQARRGQRFEVSATSDAFDTYLIVRGPGGLGVDNDDDANGNGGTNSRVIVEALADGPITVGVTSYAAGMTGAYSVQVRQAGAGAQVTAAPRAPTPVRVGAAPVRGTLASGDETLNSGEFVDTYSVDMRAGQTVTVEMDSAAFDTYLIAGGPGDVRVENDDGQGTGTNARATFTATQAGTYFIRATSFEPGMNGAYTLRVREGRTAGAVAPPPPPPAAGAQLVAGRPVNGTLAASDRRSQGGQYVDTYTFQGRAGQRVVIDMSSGNFDTVVNLVSPSGAREQHDDIGNGNTNSRLETILATDGVYRIEATSFQPQTAGSYTLVLNTQTGATQPTRPANRPQGGSRPGTLALDVTGRLERGDETLDNGQFLDAWTFQGRAGQTVTIDVTSSDFDTQVVVVAPSGDGDMNDDGPDGTNSQLVYRLPETGEYAVGVTSYAAGEVGSYRLRVAEGGAGLPQAGGGGRVYGVFVGVSQYPNPRDNLADTDEDASKLADTLQRNGVLAEESVVLVNGQATRAAIMQAIRTVGAAAGPEDTFMVFYSGHGSKVPHRGGGTPEPDGQDETLAVYDGHITDDDMAAAFESINARVSILALDSCFSGGFARDVVSRPGVMGLFSSEEDLTSQVADKFEAGGFLSYFLRLGIGGAADENRDRAVSAGELSTYLRRRFAEEGDISAVTDRRQRNYQYLVVERGSVKVDDVLVSTGTGAGGRS